MDIATELVKQRKRLHRHKRTAHKLASLHTGKEATHYNYYAGWSLGYLIGMIREIETNIEMLEELERR